ncbi:nitrous oxide reductase accessory protein NosL [Hoeflea sp.]|uniref:nitrous oxide reductase accessory protein NosL n=1 Tax=Hoeflea sp. TaxID=1940281 RepID=UPI0019A5079B|nr:nitrous oxide reductase accessory protein NosL [Hoeflea sp.]MBC7284257.1 nitrous oxide reductase accessory protein NosL [Hoeflea sp.]
MKTLTRLAALVAVAITISACSEQKSNTEVPLPVALSEESVGHYCSMTILEHTGPKAQIHLAGNPHPIWFSQVRDGIAFTRSPEESYEAVVVYVNDMGKADDWDFPGFETWIDAREAWFVIGSRKTGGMGTPEVIPFGTEQAASGFAEENGGVVVQLAGIPDGYVLGPTGLDPENADLLTGALQ